MFPARMPCIGEDPAYQRIKHSLKDRDDQDLQTIVTELSPRVDRREANLLWMTGIAIGGTLASLATAAVFEHLGMKDAATVAGTYVGGSFLATGLLTSWVYGVYTGTGSRRQEQYQSVAAETILSQRKEE